MGHDTDNKPTSKPGETSPVPEETSSVAQPPPKDKPSDPPASEDWGIDTVMRKEHKEIFPNPNIFTYKE